jgi:hypothetical protein
MASQTHFTINKINTKMEKMIFFQLHKKREIVTIVNNINKMKLLINIDNFTHNADYQFINH